MEISRHWRLRGQRYGLTGSACTQCGKTFFTPRAVCDECQSAGSEVYEYNHRRIRRQAMVEEPAHR